MQRFFNVGKIVNTHGVKGEVRVIPITDFDERFAPGNLLYFFADDQAIDPQELIVKSHRKHKQFDLLTFESFETIDDVEHFKGGVLKIPESELHELNEGEFYYYEIIGCEVYKDDGDFVGTIKEILQPGANDVWVVERKGLSDALIPYIDSVVKKVDVENKQVIIEEMEGLLD
ncbi:ribosome maturation factor RimM [Tenuibacillus multivorans]|uniref:Ribosome maturation factor RimM n=1 Tax=Tenuibacillus multivorans TaxID=237069 RepID=A0A1G9Y1V0_9BACI|nr:ribosome maturation factor RimM [Tenuibacillus multivorans]GEL75899.1 ribosome maturation factor RimM [Tenuibacillus multivorans]SDN02646.1 16S rRNA processing protein RimM [Tenuibacillus multivorans]